MNWYRMGEIEENIPRKKPLRLGVGDWRGFVRRSTCSVGWDKREDAIVVGLAAKEGEEEDTWCWGWQQKKKKKKRP